MSFLAPFALFLTAAAAVPLVLHLLRHRTGEKIDFPAVRYMLRAAREHSRELKIRNLLLMVLRVAIVLALALAAARPVGRLFGGGHAPTAFAIVLDNSLSTSAVVDGAPVLARLKDAARGAVARASSGDRLWLVTADARVVGASTATVRAALDRAEPLAGAGDLRAAVARAVQLVKGAGIPARQIAIVTDAQASAWTTTLPLDDVTATVYAVPGAVPRNRAVLRAAAEPAHWTPRGAVRAATSSSDSVTYRVAVGTRSTARGSAAPGADLVVRLDPSERGWLAGSVELEPDELRGDDQRFFAVHVGAAPSVVAEAGAGAFGRTAVDALVQEGRVTRGADVALTSADAARRPGVIFAPTDPVQISAANRALERANIPWRYGAAHSGPAPVRGAGLANVTATKWYALEPRGVLEAGATDTLARVGGDPWAVAGDGYVLVASPLSADATDLPLRASWVPWLGAAVAERLAGEAGAVTDVAPGAMVSRPPWARELELPDGSVRPVRDARMAAPDRVGVYFWRRGSARAGALVVNVEAAESDLARLTPAVLRSRFTGGDATVSADVARWTAEAFTVSGRRTLEGAFLWLALALLALEAWVARAPAARRAE